MCDCENIGFGTFDNQIITVTPEGKKVGIDKCIAKEIKYLWALNVKTMGCCCGHNKAKGSVAVAMKDVEFMKKLGYQCLFIKDNNGKYREDIFETKTHRNKEGKIIFK